MANELRRNVINMKSLDQNIKDPIVAGAGDANGRSLTIIFTQEAAAQITPATHIYLKWRHQQTDVIGYNVFTQKSEKPQTWEIHFPKALLREGDVTATIELVDDISIAVSTTFNIHVMSDPYQTNKYDDSDDFSEFQQAAITLSTAADSAKKQMKDQACEFNGLKTDLQDAVEESAQATLAANQAAAQAAQVAEYYMQNFVEINEF